MDSVACVHLMDGVACVHPMDSVACVHPMDSVVCVHPLDSVACVHPIGTGITGLYHQGILYKLSSVGIGGSVLSVLTQFLSNRSQYVLVDGCRSKRVNVVSGVL